MAAPPLNADAVARRYMSVESLARARLRVIDGDAEEVMPHQLEAVIVMT